MRLLRKVVLLILLGAPALAGLPAPAGAQSLPDPVQYAVAPEVPGPNQSVVIEVQGVGQLLGNSTITWSNNGTVVQKGTGLSRYSFTTGALGSHTTIGVTIQSTQGTFARTFVFAPSLVNLVWEANTTVPPLFRGKALYSAGSPLKIVALPVVYQGGSLVAASSLSYQWSLNDEPKQNASGLGRSAFSFVGDQLHRSEDVSVDVYYGASKVARGEVVVPASNPALVLYERDPLRGLLLDTAFPSAVTLFGQELTLQAQPYYFSRLDNQSGSLSYSWQLNGDDVTGPDTGSGILTLRQTGSGEGSAQVSVTLQDQNSSAFVQNASAALNLFFGNSGSLLNNLFGT